MKASAYALAAVLCAAPALATAQNPVSDAFRSFYTEHSAWLVSSIEAFPAAKLGYKPTKAQMTVRAIAQHLSGGNDFFCSAIGGVPAPQREKLAATATKAELVARLRETFQFCDSALAKLTDAMLPDSVQGFRGKTTRASLVIISTGDWADHYSQLANYLRLNGMLPPSAKPRRGGM
jgi:DinB superfamily